MTPEENTTPTPSKSSTGLQSNIAGALCYALGWITGLIFILIEKEDKFVRFHAMQSLITFVAATVVSIVLSVLAAMPYLGFIFILAQSLFSLAVLALWIILIVNAAQGGRYKLPIIGEVAEKNI